MVPDPDKLSARCGNQDAPSPLPVGPPRCLRPVEGTVEPSPDSAPQGSAPRPRDVFPRLLPRRLARIGCRRGKWAEPSGRVEEAVARGRERGIPLPRPSPALQCLPGTAARSDWERGDRGSCTFSGGGGSGARFRALRSLEPEAPAD